MKVSGTVLSLSVSTGKTLASDNKPVNGSREFPIRLSVGQWGALGLTLHAQGCLIYVFGFLVFTYLLLPFSLWLINIAPTHSEGLQSKMFIQELSLEILFSCCHRPQHLTNLVPMMQMWSTEGLWSRASGLQGTRSSEEEESEDRVLIFQETLFPSTCRHQRDRTF